MSAITELTAELVMKSLGHRPGVTPQELADGIYIIQTTLMRLKVEEEGRCSCAEPRELKKKLPSPEKSVKKNVVVCLECGQGFRALYKKHLLKAHGLTPGEYREKHGLPKDFPLVCLHLREHRHQVAVEQNLVGRMHSARRIRHEA